MSLPSCQVIQTKAGPIMIPVPAGWTAAIGATELVIAARVIPDPADLCAVDRIEITLRWDDSTGRLRQRCRVRKWGVWSIYDPKSPTQWTQKYGMKGWGSTLRIVMPGLLHNGRLL